MDNVSEYFKKLKLLVRDTEYQFKFENKEKQIIAFDQNSNTPYIRIIQINLLKNQIFIEYRIRGDRNQIKPALKQFNVQTFNDVEILLMNIINNFKQFAPNAI